MSIKQIMRSIRVFSIVCVAMVISSQVAVGALTLKMASTAPQNSPYGRVIESIGSEFASATNGEVKLRIFHGGSAGSESDVLRKTVLGQIDMAIITSVGIGEIDESVLTLSIPGLIADDGELAHILQKLGPNLQREINATKYELLGWVGAGWIYPFATIPFRRPADLRSIKIAGSEGNEKITHLYRSLRYNPVPLPFTEWITALNSGLIQGFFSSPIIAAASQWFGIADNMVQIKLSPFLGAVVVSDRAWKRIDAKYKPRLRAIIRQHLATFAKESSRLEDEAIATMKRFNLNVIQPTEAEETAWREYFDIDERIQSGGSNSSVRDLFDIPLYNSIRAELTRYRQTQ